jgi:hypothetical protein
MPELTHIVCSNPTCDKSFKDNRWSKIKAGGAGWFFQKDGSAWCPEHIPDWVKTWRIKYDSK